ncbi:glycosyltransferase family 87 protein [Bradyrhizobium sp. CCBAU 51627]|uniref:glycosyltransferase family 87 protein n=1 Tax=Bradyrhizobium sp. CCBAU 51627 TaxID=1325088 RepID=UPI002306A3F6|nr:glycosyltransferase family 87 protein [Bradyrhizobium sp. CCBAU 51627]
MTSVDQPERFRAPQPQATGTELFNPSRLRLVARCWIVVAAIGYVINLLGRTRVDLTDGIRSPFGDDFINYWSGAYLALHGRAAEVYDFVAFHDFETSVVGPHIDFYHYSYPPVLLLLTAPLALVPYVPALFAWLAATWYGFYRALKLAAADNALLLSLAAPAMFINAIGGQNGALTAAVMGGGLLLVDRRPTIAGILFGLLVYKPHLALMLPVAMIAGRRWRVVIAAGVTAVLLIAASVVVFGPAVWAEYQHNVSVLRTVILEDGAGVWHRMVSVFVSVRRLGGGVALSYAVQGLFALATALVVGWSWLRNDPVHIRNALVVVGTCLATPYLQDYDLVIGAFAVVWLKNAQPHSQVAAHWFDAGAAMVLLLPIVAASLAKWSGLAFGPLFFIPPFILLGALAMEQRRAYSSSVAR